MACLTASLCALWLFAFAFRRPEALAIGARRRGETNEALLQRDSSRLAQVPFIVSFRVRIGGGLDNELLAERLARSINEANTSAAALFAYSTARLAENGTFPPIDLPVVQQQSPDVHPWNSPPEAAAAAAPVPVVAAVSNQSLPAPPWANSSSPAPGPAPAPALAPALGAP
eukprot:CAMPEP_0176091026 /NCGR_PEP_ID=MMETSP0120_2-20121206/45589_1 /TAXON_ID=160619 /ORGANISM="Kryptoperidinium foliaceum, Strain CCMP 1326" /LENGTH=170 /DNA_ID=CAMNT_0017424911 /DNA_START=143 /DNA_END=652 /DNA_ORIENTATION=+